MRPSALASLLLLSAGCSEPARAADARAPAADVEPAPTTLDVVSADPSVNGDLAPPAIQVDPAPRWPAEGAPLTAPELPWPARARRIKVYLDAGHGAPGNTGAVSAFCESEADFTLEAAEDLARRLRETRRFVVKVSRKGAQRPRYPARVEEAEAWGADVFLSLHFDARGYAEPWEAQPGRWCYRSDGTPGFSVLLSDHAPALLKSRRFELARAVSNAMAATGMLAYDGFDYGGQYDADETPGVFIDRRQPGNRVFVLRRPTVPSIVIETHHALDVAEATRWREERTREAFAQAVAVAVSGAVHAWRAAPATSAGR